MKTTIFTLAFGTLIIGTVTIACKPSTKEENESKVKVEVAKENLVEAQKALTAEEWKVFKENTDSIINENEFRINELKVKMKKAGKSIDVNYKKNIDILEQKNQDLKVKVDTYKKDSDSDWKSFKREFNHDMDELGHALKDLTVNNSK